MLEAALWGFVGASALIVAAEFAFGIKVSRLVVGLIMAFGVGALISSVAFELMVPALQSAPGWQVALAAATGSIVFFVGDRLIATVGGSGRKNPEGSDKKDDEDMRREPRSMNPVGGPLAGPHSPP